MIIVDDTSIYEFEKALIEMGGLYSVQPERTIMRSDEKSQPFIDFCRSWFDHTITRSDGKRIVQIQTLDKELPIVFFSPGMATGNYVLLNPFSETIVFDKQWEWFYRNLNFILSSLLKMVMCRLINGEAKYEQLPQMAKISSKVDSDMMSELEKLRPCDLLIIHYHQTSKTATAQTNLHDDELHKKHSKVRKKTWEVFQTILEEIFGTKKLNEDYKYTATLLRAPATDAMLHIVVKVAKALEPYTQSLLDTDLKSPYLEQYLDQLEGFNHLYCWVCFSGTPVQIADPDPWNSHTMPYSPIIGKHNNETNCNTRNDMMQEIDNHITEALQVLSSLDLPRAQQNERSALSLLALLNLTPSKQWNQSESPMIGITPIMDWMSQHYEKNYKPNTRETVRRQTMHQFVDAGIALYNPDMPERPVNSPHAVYQISTEALMVLKSFGSSLWQTKLKKFLADRPTLTERYAKPRQLEQVPVRLNGGHEILLSPGKHSELIKSIIDDFGSRFVPDGQLVYAGDTGEKWGYFDEKLLAELGVKVEAHGKMPDTILFCPKRKWLILVEAVTSHGPVDGKRHEELARLFAHAKVGLVYVTAFPDRGIMGRYLGEIAWETEVWVADAPTHLIHFNGSRFLGPYN